MRKLCFFIIALLLIPSLAFGAIEIQDEGTKQGYANKMNFTGAGVSVNHSGITSTVSITTGAGATGTINTIKENGVQVGGADIEVLDFLGADFNLTESPDKEVNIVIEDSGIDHDATTNFVANEHLDWTSDLGATNLHANNIPDLSTTYEPAGITESDVSDLDHTATAITDGLIIEADLNADEAPTDNDILTFDSTGANFSWQTPTELSLQPLESTLTDIADGTIAENLVNTANPWAANELISTVIHEGEAGTSLTALNGENIQNDTIDDDSIDFTDVTLLDFGLATTHDTSSELDALYEGELNNEAGLYSALSDVTNFLQTGDAIAGDDITDGSIDSTEIGAGTIDETDLDTSADDSGIEFVIDGGGSAITTGVVCYIEVPYACTISGVTLLADQSGSIVVDIWKDAYANYPPTDADTITASAVPEISSATKDQDLTLTGWTTTVTKGDILGFNVDSATTVEKVTVSLRVDR